MTAEPGGRAISLCKLQPCQLFFKGLQPSFWNSAQRIGVTLMKKLAVGLGLLLLATGGQAAEVSLISGLYQSEENKLDGDDAGGEQVISLGGRFGDDMDARMLWFGEGSLALRSYDAPKGGKAPSNSTSLSLGGGVRMYFDPFSESVAPYVLAQGSYRNEKRGQPGVTTVIETEESGLYYGASVGVRIGLDNQFFIDLESVLFDSPLFTTETTETTTIAADGTTTKSKEETSETDLYIDTAGAFQNIVVGMGMML